MLFSGRKGLGVVHEGVLGEYTRETGSQSGLGSGPVEQVVDPGGKKGTESGAFKLDHYILGNTSAGEFGPL